MTLTKSFAIAAAMLLSTAANAGTINVTPSDIGNSFTVGFDGFANDSVIDGLSAEATFTLTEATGSSYTFDYDIANTSGGAIDASRVSIFGFNTDPTISGATSTGLFSEVNTNANVPSGFGQVDVCFKGSGDGNSCSGGGGTGVWMGDSTSGSFTLTFDQA
ncbi:MAG TPA: cistern family PEP-CTERM protein, partial [Allosphingosinicella sp.]